MISMNWTDLSRFLYVDDGDFYAMEGDYEIKKKIKIISLVYFSGENFIF